MKRFLSFLLCVIMLLSNFYVVANAEEEQCFYRIKIDAGSGVITEKALVQDKEIYIPAKNFSNYTRFSFNEESKMFLIKNQELNKSFKSVVVDTENKRILVSGTKIINLTNIFVVNETIYLPLCQMLPILNADIYTVKDNVIYISNNKLSLAEILYNFDISDYYFNLSTEFDDMKWAALLTIVPNYVWDTLVNIRYDRLDIAYNSGEYNDYKDIFSEFIAEDNLYLKAMAKKKETVSHIIDFYNGANEFMKDSKSIYDWVDEAGKTDISSETGGALLEFLQLDFDSERIKDEEIYSISEAWTKGKISFSDCIELINYIYKYQTVTNDNKNMLEAVYDLDFVISDDEPARKAAKHIHDLYSKNFIPALFEEIATEIATDNIKNLNPIGLYTATAKLAGILIEKVMPFKPGDVANLPIYADIVLSSSYKFHSLDTSTDESTNNLRCSLLFCLTASKKCFEIMREAMGDSSTYYDNKIEKIEKLIIALYIAEENTEFDSFEHFDEYRKNNIQKLNKALFYDNLSDMAVPQTVEAFVSESNKMLKEGRLKPALLSLYECIEMLGNSAEIQKAIDDYFNKVTFTISASPGTCDKEFCFKDKNSDNGPNTKNRDLGIMLIDKQNNIKETLARITFKYEMGYSPQDNDATIVGHNGDTWLFYAFCGAGKCSTFLYTIHTNKLNQLYGSPVEFDINDDIIMGSSLRLDVSEPFRLFAYDWSGKNLYIKENVSGGFSIKDGWLFFMRAEMQSDKYVYKLYKNKLRSSKEKVVCTIEIPPNGFLYIDKHSIQRGFWSYSDGEPQKIMSLSNPHNVTIKQ